MRSFRFVALAAALVLLAACGGGEDHSNHQPEAAPSAAGDGHAHSHEGFLFGEPAAPGAATTKIEVAAKDFEFVPNELTVDQGDVVEFVVTNSGDAQHEFVLGDAALMEELGSTAHQHGADEPNAVAPLEPGDTGTMVWNFTQPGRFRFECHIDAHHKLGMTGTITVIGN